MGTSEPNREGARTSEETHPREGSKRRETFCGKLATNEPKSLGGAQQLGAPLPRPLHNCKPRPGQEGDVRVPFTAGLAFHTDPRFLFHGALDPPSSRLCRPPGRCLAEQRGISPRRASLGGSLQAPLSRVSLRGAKEEPGSRAERARGSGLCRAGTGTLPRAARVRGGRDEGACPQPRPRAGFGSAGASLRLSANWRFPAAATSAVPGPGRAPPADFQRRTFWALILPGHATSS